MDRDEDVARARFGNGLRLPWSRSDRTLPRTIVRALQTFLQTETAGGMLLLVAATTALVWANSPWSASYERLWHTELTLRVGDWSFAHDLREWVNEGLMTIFFFVVGLEIKREIVTGELRDPRAAALPVAAAIGGMIAPAAIYAALTLGTGAARGWGIPMATDIAFALGALTIAGRRLPSSLKLFLLALAIVDDIGAILVIAIFYAGGIAWNSLAVAIGLVGLVLVLRRIAVRATFVYVVVGVVLWFAVLDAGIHATIAGVVLGLLTPASPFQRPRAVSDEAQRVAVETEDDPQPPDADAPQWLWLAALSREAVSPLGRLENLLHPWSSFVIVPLFALANAGVKIGADSFGGSSARIVLAIVAGLVLGKIAGIMAGSWLAVRLGARLPAEVSLRDLSGVSAVAGIGFTVSLFVADLAFPEGPLLDAAKLGVLGGSVLAVVVGSAMLRARSRSSARPS